MITLIAGTICYIAVAIGFFSFSYNVAQAKYQRLKSKPNDFEKWYEREYGSRYIAYSVLWPLVLFGAVILSPIYTLPNACEEECKTWAVQRDFLWEAL